MEYSGDGEGRECVGSFGVGVGCCCAWEDVLEGVVCVGMCGLWMYLQTSGC